MGRAARWWPVGLAVIIATLASCGGADPRPPQPVRGQVFFRNAPAAGATVTFVPRDTAEPRPVRPTATVDRDGTFRLTTRLAHDGAPTGRYAVTIVFPSAERKIDDENAGPDLLKGRYRDPRTTPLEVEVRSGENLLEPFRLD